MIKNGTAIIIPIRMHSTRLPGKFHHKIGNKEMILHVLDRALETGIENVYVAVDHQDHFDLITKNGGKAVMTSNEHQSGTDRIYEALLKIDPDKKIDYIVNLQGDLPFIDPHSIKQVISMIDDNKFDITTLAAPIIDKEEIDDPNCVKIAMTPQGKALYFSRCPIPYNAKKYYHHLGIYAFKRSALVKFVNLPMSILEKCEKLEQLRALENGMNIGVMETNIIPLSVDIQQDLDKAINYYNNHFS